MRNPTPLLILLLSGAAGAIAAAEEPAASEGTAIVMRQADPGEVRPGSIVAITGEHLDAGHVSKLFLTTGKEDFEAEIAEQSATVLTFRVPAGVPQGRLRIAVLEAATGIFLEEPVFVTVTGTALPTGI